MHGFLRRIGLGLFASALVPGLIGVAQSATSNSVEPGLRILNNDIVRVVYPYDLAMAGTDATVEVSFQVDSQGAATGVTVTKASNPDAAASFLAALDEMVFETAKRGGVPVVSEPQTLSVGIRQLQWASDLGFIAAIKDPAVVVIGAREVDGGLKPAGRMAPALFPSSLQKSNLKQGRAVLEFYIDQAGVVRLPKVLSSTDPAMGWSAASAVLTWRFAPPLKGGVPAIVKVTGVPVEILAVPAAAPGSAGATPPAVDRAAATRPATMGSGVGLTASILVDSVSRGSKLKVNGALTDILPVKVIIAVDESGFALKQYVIALSLNILPNGAIRGAPAEVTNGNPGQFILEQGQPAPARIYFETDGPQAYGTAVINRPP